jgi:hypothetical protein
MYFIVEYLEKKHCLTIKLSFIDITFGIEVCDELSFIT